MPTEKLPRKQQTIRKGGRTWKIDPEEIRLREGSVDEKGVRRVPLFLDPNEKTSVATQTKEYLRLGYVIDDERSTEYERVFKIDNKIFLKREKEKHDKARSRSAFNSDRAELSSLGIKTSLEELDAMNPSDFDSAFSED